MTSPASGVYAALITPIDDLGRIDIPAFDRVIDFVADRGVNGVVVGGGTGEYPHFDVADRARVAAHAVQRMKGRGLVITCVGTSSLHSTLRLARDAAEAGSNALLVPMPYFFRYDQQDLEAYCERVCASATVPCLLYNLPSFTNGLDAQTAIHLLKTVPNLVGMKDSSGETANLQPLATARAERRYSIFVGDDSLLLGALQAGWDGVISGIACFMPELIGAVYRSHTAGKAALAAAYQATLDEVIEHVVSIPIPWGVRVGLGARGIPNGPMHVPPSPNRLRQMEELVSWLKRWGADRGVALPSNFSLPA